MADAHRPRSGTPQAARKHVRRDPPGNLPLAFTRFVGRTRELRDLRRLIVEIRLLTLVGVGGIGKSRLALEAAERAAARFPGGAWHVDLASLIEGGGAETVMRAIADVLGIRERSGPALRVAMVDYLNRESALLILEQCEGVVDSAAIAVTALLSACPDLHVLATSRRPLRAVGETTYDVRGLGLDPAANGDKTADRDDAVALFIDRVRLHRPSFRLSDRSRGAVLGLCRRLDGMPLAIELAAARLRHLELDDLVAELDDQPALLRQSPRTAPERQTSVEASVAWSVRFLSGDSAAVFSALSVFRGGFDRAAAEALSSQRTPSTTLDVLSELVDQSIVAVSEGLRGKTRYRILEPVRQVAASMLRASGREQVSRAAHATYFAALASRCTEARSSADEVRGWDLLDLEADNLRSALEYAAQGQPDLAVRLATNLCGFWTRHGDAAEGRAWMERLLPYAVGLDAARGALGLAGLLAELGDTRRARSMTEGVIARLENGDTAGAVRAHVLLGQLVHPDGDAVRAAFARALQLARDARSEGLVCEVTTWSADFEWLLGNRTAAVEQATAARQAARKLENPGLVAAATAVLARDATFPLRPEADRLWEECLRASREFGDPTLIHFTLLFVALQASWRGDIAVAAASLVEAADMAGRAGGPLARVHLIEHVGLVLIRFGLRREGARLIASGIEINPEFGSNSPWWRDHLQQELRAAAGMQDPFPRSPSGELDLAAVLSLAEHGITTLSDMASASPRFPGLLTRRETEVAHLVRAGFTNREIGRRLYISERTVDSHVQHLLNKLGFANRAQVAAWAAEHPFEVGSVEPI